MSYLEGIINLLPYILIVVVFIHGHIKYAEKADKAIDCMIAYDEQAPSGPYHIIYREARLYKWLYWAASIVTIYTTIMEIRHVYTLITAG